MFLSGSGHTNSSEYFCGCLDCEPTPLSCDPTSGDNGSEDFVTTGGKWGDSGTLGTAGGVVTWSLGGAGLFNSTGVNFYTGPSVALGSFLGFSFETVLQTAFNAWSAVANIEFIQIEDGGGNIGVGSEADIRVVGGFIDGPSNVLARAFFPGPGGTASQSATRGDMVFDSGETTFWTPSSFFLVAAHEIGHSIGLNHEQINLALMNPFFNSALSGLQTDDINGARAIYGAQDGGDAVYRMASTQENLNVLQGTANLVVVGNSMSNTINGTNSAETILGEGGNDTLLGQGGNDSLHGGDGDDLLGGGSGRDTLVGGDGNDGLDGGDDADVIYGGNGNDNVIADDGDDYVSGGAGNDFIRGGIEGDVLDGDDGDDTILGEAGWDLIRGGSGNDLLGGGSGRDTIFGGSGNDIIDAGDDRDTVYGESGNDTIVGDDGDDYLNGGSGNDFIRGGIEGDVIDGEDGDDTLVGEDGWDHLRGGSGNDIIDAGNGNDILEGGSGNDILSGEQGADTMTGGSGNDLFRFGVTDGQIDTVMDFEIGIDQILLATGASIANVLASAQSTGSSTVIDVAAGVGPTTYVSLIGVTGINASWFVGGSPLTAPSADTPDIATDCGNGLATDCGDGLATDCGPLMPETCLIG